MTVRIVRRLTLLLLVLLAGAVASPRCVPALASGGSVEVAGGMRILRLSGTPYEMGLQQGTLLRDSVREKISGYLYDRIVGDSGAEHFWLLAQSRLIEPLLPAATRQELQGIADGAGLSFRDILLLNTIPDQLALAHTLPDASILPGLFSASMPRTESPSLCTTFVGWGSSTEQGELLLGHNLESAEDDLLRGQLLIVVRRPQAAHTTVTIGMAGGVGILAGMSDQSLAVTLSSSPSVDAESVGMPLPFLLRESLESSGDLDSLVGSLVSSNRQYGGNVIAADGKAPRAVAVELAAHSYAIFDDTALDQLVRTNHFVDAALSTTQAATLEHRVRLASQERLDRVAAWMERNRGWIGVDKALALLAEVSSWPGEEQSHTRSQQSLLFIPGDGSLWLAQSGGGATGTFVRVQFAELVGAQAQP